MAGFQVIIYGRFWVIPEASSKQQTSVRRSRIPYPDPG